MKFIFITSVFLLLLSCSSENNQNTSTYPFLPTSASIILKTNDLSKLESSITNTDIYQKNKNHLLVAHFKGMSALSQLNTNGKDIYICYTPLGKSELGTTVITPISNLKSTSENNAAKVSGEFTYNKQNYKEITLKNDRFYTTQLDSLWVATKSKLLLENCIREFQNEPIIHQHLAQSLQVLESDKSFSLLVNNNRVNALTKRLLPKKNTESPLNLSGWSAGDVSIDNTSISFDGVYSPKDSVYDYTAIFSKTIAQTNELINITPINATYLHSYTYDNYEQLSRNLALYNQKEITFESDALDDFLNETVECGEIALAENHILAFSLINEETNISDYFTDTSVTETFRDTPIYKLVAPVDFSTKLNPLVREEASNYMVQINAYVLFAATTKSLKSLISIIKNEDLLVENEWFEDFSEEIADESNALFLENISSLKDKITTGVAENYKKDWEQTNTKGYRLAALQLTTESDFTHLHQVISQTNATKIEGKVNQTANIFLDSELQTIPQFTKNYVTKTMDVVVQDKEHKVSLLSSSGKITWQKQLDAPILGKIQQMDMYRNGRLQLVFTTANALYVLDRNGNEVAPFPLKFNEPITQPIAVFDYDKNRKYRLSVIQGSTISLFDNRGKKVNGFNLKNKNKEAITRPPKHIRVGSKDYILLDLKDSGLQILSRTGKKRINLKEKSGTSINDWYWYKNAFTTITSDNLITQINPKGKISKIKPVQKGEDIVIDATSKTLVTLVENVLTIKNKKVSLDYGLYTAPKIFYINNKIFVTVTDTQASKVYLFDSNAKPISGFPVYGNSQASIANIDKDNSLELVTQGEKNNVIVYEFR